MDKKQLISKAERLCEQQNKRFTAVRKTVLKLLLGRGQPATAYQLLDDLKQQMPHAKPPTIYRSLEFLVEVGLVHRIDSTSTYIACEHLGEAHQPQLLVCDDCGSVEEISINSALIEQLAEYTSNHQFVMHKQLIEIHGYCQQCQKTN